MEQSYSDYLDASDESQFVDNPGFANRLQLFALIVYILSHAFTIPVLAIGPSWAVWPNLDDLATVFLFLVYLFTRRNTQPMNKAERFFFRLLVVGIILSLPSTIFGTLILRPHLSGGFVFGVFLTYRVVEYSTVWYCIRGMTFSSKQFDKISYALFFVAVFVVIIAIGNGTGLIPPARLISHLPRGAVAGPWEVLAEKVGASKAVGPFGSSSGLMVNRCTLLTVMLLASRRPRAVFRILVVIGITVAIFFSGARAAMISWCIAVAFLSHKSAKQLIMLMLIIVLFFTVFSLFMSDSTNPVIERATGRVSSIVHREEDPTMSGRTEQWTDIFKLISDDGSIVIMGAGWGAGGIAMQGMTESAIVNAHCMYLQVLIELGILGLLLYLYLLFRAYMLIQGKDRRLLAMRAAFFGFLVASITGEVFYPVANSGSFMGFVAALFAISVGAARGKEIEGQYGKEQYVYDEESYCEEGYENYCVVPDEK